MIVHTEYAQNSVDWMIARSGLPTASEFDQLVTPEFKLRTGAMPASYLAKKVAEAWQGGPLAELNTFDMDQGHFLEQEAIPWYELEYGVTIARPAFITTDDGRIGCSPDGLLGEDSGIEIKCPAVHTHIGYLLARTGARSIAPPVPKEYLAQIHGAMLVTGRPQWKFLSYRRRCPPLLVTVERDEKIQELLAEALSTFLARFDTAVATLTDLNGGPPRRRAHQS